MDLWFSVRALGYALEAEDADTVRTIRSRLEANFLPAPSRYGVDRVIFDPMVRYRTGEVRSRERIATFTSSTGCARIPWASAD